MANQYSQLPPFALDQLLRSNCPLPVGVPEILLHPMTRFIHDQFAKQYLTELLTPYGQVEISKDITSEVREVDVLFIPSPNKEGIELLGLLGRMAKNYTIFEPFRNAVTKSEIRKCMGKLFDIHDDIEREFNRNDQIIDEAELPRYFKPGYFRSDPDIA